MRLLTHQRFRDLTIGQTAPALDDVRLPLIDLVGSRHITIVPMLRTLDGRTFHDGEVSLEQVAGCEPQRLSTSAPTPGQFLEAIESADAGDGVVILTVATTMSSAFDSARLAARQVDVDVEVIDSRTAAGGESLVTLAADEAAAR